MAPLAGITNLPFRLIVKEEGCSLVCSEMISSNGLVHKSARTERMLESDLTEKPLSVQIFGNDPSIMSEAAVIIENSGADIIDINFGCSVRKIVKTGSGAALMKDNKKTEALLLSIRKSIQIPLTIKIRTGWDNSGYQALDISNIAEACGVDAITVHPRTAVQGFSGKADWNIIKAVKNHVSIPVIGNGDINEPADALKMIGETGCDAVMIGRAAISNPTIFSDINALLDGRPVPEPDLARRFDLMVRYLEDSVKYLGEELACKMMRSRLGWFVKGLPGCSHFREAIKQITDEETAKKLIYDYKKKIF